MKLESLKSELCETLQWNVKRNFLKLCQNNKNNVFLSLHSSDPVGRFSEMWKGTFWNFAKTTPIKILTTGIRKSEPIKISWESVRFFCSLSLQWDVFLQSWESVRFFAVSVCSGTFFCSLSWESFWDFLQSQLGWDVFLQSQLGIFLQSQLGMGRFLFLGRFFAVLGTDFGTFFCSLSWESVGTFFCSLRERDCLQFLTTGIEPIKISWDVFAV